jgi:hypothetical protein
LPMSELSLLPPREPETKTPPPSGSGALAQLSCCS